MTGGLTLRSLFPSRYLILRFLLQKSSPRLLVPRTCIRNPARGTVLHHSGDRMRVRTIRRTRIRSQSAALARPGRAYQLARCRRRRFCARCHLRRIVGSSLMPRDQASGARARIWRSLREGRAYTSRTQRKPRFPVEESGVFDVRAATR
jgi:hypothetical protein